MAPSDEGAVRYVRLMALFYSMDRYSWPYSKPQASQL